MKRTVYSFSGFLVILLMIITYLMVNGNYFKKKHAIPKDAHIEKKIDQILQKMSLDEKIGQMCQITLDAMMEGKNTNQLDTPYRLDAAKVDSVLVKYKVGSVLNTAANRGQTRAFWDTTIHTLQQKALITTKIPLLYGIDAIHGVTYTIGSTLFPQEIAMGASFNTALTRECAEICAYETRASGIAWNFSPVLDLGREPRWPRMWETYGEDAFLVSSMGVACVKGYQGTDPNHIDHFHVGACLKHYMGYGVPHSGMDRTPAYVPIRQMREKHFAPFKAAVEAGALSVMVNSAMVNGISLHASKGLLTQWLKTDLAWDGMIVSDWADVNNLYQRDHVAADKKDAIRIAINAGVDMAMVPYDWQFCKLLKELVIEKKVEITRINDAVRRILRLKYRLGLFDHPEWNLSKYPNFGSQQHATVALRAAEEAITLLKNEHKLLPLQKNTRILVCGPNANSMRTLNGGWTLSWQGEKADELAKDRNTILEAFIQKAGQDRIIYSPGVEYKMDGLYFEEQKPRIAEAVAAAGKSDVILLCLGENSYCETPGNLYDMTLSSNQLELAKSLAKTGKPIILVLNEGRPRIVSSIEPLMTAVLQTYLPGNYGGEALANIVYGETNPSGKLPYTYPRYASVFYTYDHKHCEAFRKTGSVYDFDPQDPVQWAFGYGLSYTQFAYSDLRIRIKEPKGNMRNGHDFIYVDTLLISVKVKNIGDRSGKESVLVFVADNYASITPDFRRLRAFTKIALNPGEIKEVTFPVAAKSLAFIQSKDQWTLERGSYTVYIGDQTAQLFCRRPKTWTTPNIP